MLETAQVIIFQLIKMFIYIIIGYCLFKTTLITEKGSQAIANLLIYAVIPCVILNSLLVDRTAESIRIVLYSFLGGALAMAVAMIISAVFFRKRPMDNFAGTISNAGFMGIPLITAAVGPGVVLNITGFFFIQSIVQWTYNILFMRKEGEKINFKGLFASPITISLVAGFLIFFAGIPIPSVLKDCVSSMAACNSPIAMVVLGVYIGKTRLKDIFTIPRLYLVSAVRLVIIPFFTILVLFAIPSEFMAIRTSILIVAAAPVAVNTAVYAQKAGLDYTYAVKAICLSTILSTILLPLSALAAGLIWGV